jgi:hypothetical protein
MPQRLVPVKLHRERFSQLQLLADRNGTSPAGAIEHLLSQAALRGELPDTFQGIAIARDADALAITIGDTAPLRLALPDARNLAVLIENFAGRTIDGSSTTFTSATGDMIVISRVGMAFAIVTSAARIVVSAGMVHDLTRQLRSATL